MVDNNELPELRKQFESCTKVYSEGHLPERKLDEYTLSVVETLMFRYYTHYRNSRLKFEIDRLRDIK
jgi:hypothetical protein